MYVVWKGAVRMERNLNRGRTCPEEAHLLQPSTKRSERARDNEETGGESQLDIQREREGRWTNRQVNTGVVGSSSKSTSSRTISGKAA
jgi:hypothetical protein